MELQVTRRDFLKGSIVVALGAAGASMLGSCAPSGAAATSEGATPAVGSGGSSNAVTLHRGYGAAHGDKCFTSVVVATADDGSILAVSVDDYQFMPAGSTGITPVPNSDAGLAAGYATGQVLMSKTVNTDAYSAMMKEKAQATTPWIESMAAIESFVAGQKISDVKAKGPDAVSGATLVDTAGYVKAAVEAAKAA